MSKVKLDDGRGNQDHLCCPACGSSYGLMIRAEISVKLTPDGTDNNCSDTEWSDESGAFCECGWNDAVKDLVQKPKPKLSKRKRAAAIRKVRKYLRQQRRDAVDLGCCYPITANTDGMLINALRQMEDPG